VSGWLVVMHTYLHYFPLSLSLSRDKFTTLLCDRTLSVQDGDGGNYTGHRMTLLCVCCD